MVSVVTDGLPACSTLVELLRLRARNQPDQRAYTFLADGGTSAIDLTYAELDRRARSIASALQELDVRGERAMLLLPPGLEYIAALFGCLYAGVVAVPVYPPKLNRSFARLQAIAADAQASVALTNFQIWTECQRRQLDMPEVTTLRWVITDEQLDNQADQWYEPKSEGDDLALLQYTSGSTAAPKGAMISHANVLHNSAQIYQAFEHSCASCMVSWVPPYHDMGLIFGILQPLYGGFPAVLMSPFAFAQAPLRWLEVISAYRATTTGAPNFAYDLCVERARPEALAALELSSLRVALNGAEPIRAGMIERFVATFAPCGFRPEAFSACYGLAEATAGVSFSVNADLPIIYTVPNSAAPQQRESIALLAPQSGQCIVGCGKARAGQQIVIVDPESGVPCAPELVGEIWVAGGSIAQGYWNHPEENRRVFNAYLASNGAGPFLRTGDFGFLQHGELFVTGRLKDLIIIRGRNHYPQDIELTVEQSHPALRPNCCAAFPVEIDDKEQLVVVQEVDRLYRKPPIEAIVAAIRQSVALEHEIEVYAVVLIRHGSLPKTSSGKIQRHRCRIEFLAETLPIIGASILADSSPGETALLTREMLLASVPATRQAMLERYLRERLVQMLNVDAAQIDLHTSLSFLGVDSLRGLELKSDIEDLFGVILPSGYFPLGPSIATVASEILEQLPAVLNQSQIALVPATEVVTEAPLSFGQQALWFLYQLAPKSAAYHALFIARILSEVDADVMHRTFQVLVDRHAALRMTFSNVEGDPVQRIHQHCTVDYHHEDATVWSEAMLQAHIAAETHRSFNLEHGPLLRVTLYTKPEGEHILLLVQHHIITDHWSIGVLLQELDALYPAIAAGRLVELPPPRLAYTDYVHWEREMLAGIEGERMWAYWQSQLAGLVPLELPVDHPRPAIQTYRGATYTFTIDTALTESLKSFAQAEGVTLYTCLVAAFMVLLYRYTGQIDIAVGCPTAGRNRAKLNEIVGYFVNPVVLRANLADQPPFRTFLNQMRQTVQAAFDHQEYPFALLVERLEQTRDPGRTPLFQVLFGFQKGQLLDSQVFGAFGIPVPEVQMRVGGLLFESMSLKQQTARADLTVMLAEIGGKLGAGIEYNSDLFDSDTISRMAAHFQMLLAGIVADPEQCVGLLPLLTPYEREQLLVTWNATQTTYPDSCIHELFEEQSARTPERVAVTLQGRALSYAELNARANQVAHTLRQSGIVPDTRVGICVERSLDLVVGLLGILKAGGTYIPLDPSYPTERLAFMLSDAQIDLLLTQQRLLPRLPLSGTQVLCLDADWPQITLAEYSNPQHTTRPDHLAYVMYTSGTTGTPKGVCIPHRAVVRLVRNTNYLHLDDQQIFLQLAPISFDAATLEIWGSLLNGAQLTIFPPQPPTLAEIAAILEQEQVTILWLTSGLFHQMVEHQLMALSRVPQLLAGGDVLSATHLQHVLHAGTGTTVINGYGPTENTTFTCYYAMTTAEQVGISVPIGRPIANTHVYVLDVRQQPVPIGVLGELYAGGDGLAYGYLHDSALTAERFIPNPFSGKPGARLYRTGDIVRYRPDGNLEFFGRRDHQIKVRGFRIELGEIEAMLNQHPAVRQAIVVAHTDPSSADGPLGKRLVAYILVSAAQPPTLNELQRYLQERLPTFMIPTAFMLLDNLPLTPQGKVDRAALLQQLPAQAARPEDSTAPRTPLEETLAKLWANVLHRDQIGMYENFFTIGGHSLLATQLVAQIRTTLQIDIPLHQLFEAPTVAELAVVLSATGRVSDDDLRPAQIRSDHLSAQQLLAQLDHLSDAEVDQLLRTQLQGLAERKDVQE
jgi:amino acid adenylation domain-containing protein